MKLKNIEIINTKNIFYKMGVICGEMLYSVDKFDNFEKMIQEAKQINDKYKRDMMNCMFVFQAFRDESYDFEKSCFFQTKLFVNDIENKIDALAKSIFAKFVEELK